MKIWLNEKAEKCYGHLMNEWLSIYGYSEKYDAFLIWDGILDEWHWIPRSFCEGKNN